MHRFLLASVLILCTVFTGCFAQSGYEPIDINTFTSRRIMLVAAEHIGVELTREISAFKKIDEPWYIVNFEGSHPSGWTWTCTAKVHEPSIGRGYVVWWRCRF
ncbi:uncharacterized protein LOC132736285 [Ruditapes philippinarum]|uniref:uncharacterized protein LOC132736285 n=1 Tax=Ruditapes philippinarum TaxID=129788 RepID=UPI00295C10E5|nr:uncharacterized protein LOC132736285 [Ruditapes philippinarum]